MNIPLPPNITRLEIWLVGIVVALLALIAYGFYERYEGAKNCKAEVRTERREAVAHNTVVESSAATAGATANAKLTATTAAPVAATPTIVTRIVRVEPSCPVPATAAVPSETPSDLRATIEARRLQADTDTFIRSSVQRGKNADAEVIFWREQLGICHAVAAGKPSV